MITTSIYIYVCKKIITKGVSFNNLIWNLVKYMVDLALGVFLIVSILLTHYSDTSLVKEMDNHIRKSISNTKKNIIKNKTRRNKNEIKKKI